MRHPKNPPHPPTRHRWKESDQHPATHPDALGLWPDRPEEYRHQLPHSPGVAANCTATLDCCCISVPAPGPGPARPIHRQWKSPRHEPCARPSTRHSPTMRLIPALSDPAEFRRAGSVHRLWFPDLAGECSARPSSVQGNAPFHRFEPQRFPAFPRNQRPRAPAPR
ncbi:hypothetical protein D3C72_1837400 [compost metagenome]